jgi:hypothetical protein
MTVVLLVVGFALIAAGACELVRAQCRRMLSTPLTRPSRRRHPGVVARQGLRSLQDATADIGVHRPLA